MNHQLDVKFQESYLKKVVDILRCRLTEGAVGGKEVDAGASDKLGTSDEVEDGELPDAQG